ncbi:MULTISPECIES: SDR family NAD(P)-dependent oxidoreductase [Haloferax]|uniref:3-oxoacyl-[acyl-carrier-protein] reductase FabG n=1 Tax=Haloferax massiliensis TaxID=1476858 RepID=A0A0D6JVW8_9EURY|nr:MULTISPECIES: SDR family oxidoreductase [Haloferax]MDS0243290.1 SDR family oxidoreductase [Haloferax sp. S2CR25]MDS0446411.1 SDR family oxidoreductase [Haloferax sp. S2CR25-2]CQR52719.1 3-oxoacyl-[acyl-carrier-protein] reductase FabG [Haloferax massiliensis]
MVETSPTVTVSDSAAVVIGGTSGIGRAIALAFADDGADVVATSRSADAVEETAEELRARGAETAEVTCDVRDNESIENLYEVASDAIGDIDILVNSAGSVARASVSEMSDDQWNQDIDVNLTGVFRACRVFGREMESGSIVNISSMSARQAREERPAYCAAKSGVNGLTRAAAADLAPDVRVNAIEPGFVKTPLAGDGFNEGTELREKIDEGTPMERVATPDEIAGAAVYLASDAASFTTGAVITVDGGYNDNAL